MNKIERGKLKEKIIELRNSGKKLKEIKEILNCSYSTISYHLYNKTKESTIKRYERSVETGKKNEYQQNFLKKGNNALKTKYVQFFRVGKGRNKMSIPVDERMFTFEELLKIIGENPICYLTGEKIDIKNTGDYSLDHKIPSSRNGGFDLENVGLCKPDVNIAKNNKTPEEFIELCKKVLLYNGYEVNKK